MGQLDGKVAIITGASQGIGNAIAHGLAAEGARIVVADLHGAAAAAEAFPDGVGPKTRARFIIGFMISYIQYMIS